ncbi:MAG: T9SS type A sorting domain-containing protein [Chitinophagaceae bacterium]|nr:T9SS type A sorting domain-containing protein [Chitinophagaceae bacterium]
MKNLHFKKYLPMLVVLALVTMSYTTASLLSNPNCPTNYTGAPKAVAPIGQVRYCTSCHGDFTMNTAGGGMVVTGLPVVKYTPGLAYNFSIRINHAAADRKIWGFAIKAVNTVNNQVVGTFSSTNANATVKGTAAGQTLELSHASCPTTTNTNNYTFLNLKWTAPAAPGANDANIRFYITGNAGDNDGGEAGDYIYTTTLDAAMTALPLTLGAFSLNTVNDAEVKLQWQTLQEINTAVFEIETSADGVAWNRIGNIAASGTSTTPRSYSLTDKRPLNFNSTIYYRLKMIDRDGSYTYSEVKTTRLKNAGVVIRNLSAQPIQKGQNAIFEIHSNEARNLSVTVFDVNGTTLSRKNTILIAGANRVEVPVSNNVTAQGVYFVKFTAEGFEKVIKQVVNQ